MTGQEKYRSVKISTYWYIKEEQFMTQSYTVKPDQAVTSIKQSPVLKGHTFLVLS
jgi:hypothetical protein